MMSKMFRRATYWTSEPEERRVTVWAEHISICLEKDGRWARDRGGRGGLTEWRPHLLLQHTNQVLILHVIHQVEDNFNGCQDNCRVGMLKANRNSFGKGLGIQRIGGRER